MKKKRLMCVLLALALALPVTVHAVEEEGILPAAEELPAGDEIFPEEDGILVPSDDPVTDEGFTEEENEPPFPAEEDLPTEDEPVEEESSDGDASAEWTDPGEEPSEEETFPGEEEFPNEEALPIFEDEPIEEEPITEEPAAEEEPPVIRVSVPDSGRVIVNPYSQNVTLYGNDSTDQVVSAAQPIINYSDVPVTVWASASGSASAESGIVYATIPPSGQSGQKELFLYAEFQPDNAGGWRGGYDGAGNQLLITESASDPQPVMELAAGESASSAGQFRLFGSAAVTTGEAWSREDTFRVTLTLTFVPDGSSPQPEDGAKTQINTEDSIPDEDDEQPVVDSLPAQEYPGLVFAPTEETEPFPGFAPADAVPLETVE